MSGSAQAGDPRYSVPKTRARLARLEQARRAKREEHSSKSASVGQGGRAVHSSTHPGNRVPAEDGRERTAQFPPGLQPLYRSSSSLHRDDRGAMEDGGARHMRINAACSPATLASSSAVGRTIRTPNGSMVNEHDYFSNHRSETAEEALRRIQQQHLRRLETLPGLQTPSRGFAAGPSREECPNQYPEPDRRVPVGVPLGTSIPSTVEASNRQQGQMHSTRPPLTSPLRSPAQRLPIVDRASPSKIHREERKAANSDLDKVADDIFSGGPSPTKILALASLADQSTCAAPSKRQVETDTVQKERVGPSASTKSKLIFPTVLSPIKPNDYHNDSSTNAMFHFDTGSIQAQLDQLKARQTPKAAKFCISPVKKRPDVLPLKKETVVDSKGGVKDRAKQWDEHFKSQGLDGKSSSNRLMLRNDEPVLKRSALHDKLAMLPKARTPKASVQKLASAASVKRSDEELLEDVAAAKDVLGRLGKVAQEEGIQPAEEFTIDQDLKEKAVESDRLKGEVSENPFVTLSALQTPSSSKSDSPGKETDSEMFSSFSPILDSGGDLQSPGPLTTQEAAQTMATTPTKHLGKENRDPVITPWRAKTAEDLALDPKISLAKSAKLGKGNVLVPGVKGTQAHRENSVKAVRGAGPKVQSQIPTRPVSGRSSSLRGNKQTLAASHDPRQHSSIENADGATRAQKSSRPSNAASNIRVASSSSKLAPAEGPELSQSARGTKTSLRISASRSEPSTQQVAQLARNDVVTVAATVSTSVPSRTEIPKRRVVSDKGPAKLCTTEGRSFGGVANGSTGVRLDGIDENAEIAPIRRKSDPVEHCEEVNAAHSYLEGVIAFVEVRTLDGENCGDIFRTMLRNAGAKVVTHFGPSTTHVIYKSGSPALVHKAQSMEVPPLIVGVGWVVECLRQDAWVNETSFKIAQDEVPKYQKRRRSMQPKQMAILTTVTTQASTGDDMTSARLNRLENARARTLQHAPRVSSPLATRL